MVASSQVPMITMYGSCWDLHYPFPKDVRRSPSQHDGHRHRQVAGQHSDSAGLFLGFHLNLIGLAINVSRDSTCLCAIHKLQTTKKIIWIYLHNSKLSFGTVIYICVSFPGNLKAQTGSFLNIQLILTFYLFNPQQVVCFFFGGECSFLVNVQSHTLLHTGNVKTSFWLLCG